MPTDAEPTPIEQLWWNCGYAEMSTASMLKYGMGIVTEHYKTAEEYLTKKSAFNPQNGCQEWTGVLTSDGYGRVSTRDLRRRGFVSAHRASYAERVGPIPLGMEIDHLCYNRKCINPEHLRAVTRQENQKGRRHNPETHAYRRGEESHLAILNREQVLNIRKLRQEGLKLREISHLFKVSQGTVSLICSRKTWFTI